MTSDQETMSSASTYTTQSGRSLSSFVNVSVADLITHYEEKELNLQSTEQAEYEKAHSPSASTASFLSDGLGRVGEVCGLTVFAPSPSKSGCAS